MIKKFNDLSLFWKILFLLISNLLFFVIVFQFILSQQIEELLLNERKKNLKEKVLVVVQMSSAILEKYQQGIVNKQEAEKEIIFILSKLTPSENEYYFIFDDKNKMIYHPDAKLRGTDISKLKDINGKFIIQEIQEKLKDKNEAFTEYYWQKLDFKTIAPKITYSFKIPDTNWIIASGIYIDDLKNEVRTILNKIYFYLFLILIISVTMTYFFVMLLTKRLKKSKNIYDNIQKGNFLLQEETYYKDEFGLLEQALYKTIDYISNIFDKIIPISIRLEQSAKNLKNVSVNTKSSVENQYKNFEQISAAVEETSVTIGEISKLLNETSLESTNSMEECNKTLDISKDTSQIINKINELFKNLLRQFESIQNRFNNIQNVISLLNEISRQTNLIALNASIEAAKRGEQGSRFTVIAEEIRKLSLNSRESTKEISSLINSITEDINNYKNQIEGFGDDVTLAVENFQKLERFLKNVVQAFQNINIKINQLATSTEELSTASKDVAKNVEMNLTETEKILQLSEKTSNLAVELVEILEELRNSTVNIKTKSYNKFIFDLAKTDHEIFVDKIQGFLEDKIKLSLQEVSEYTKCRFGKWYYSEESKNFQNFIEFKQIEEPHKKVHELAKKAYESKNQNNIQEAKEYFNQMLNESKNVIFFLEKLKEHI
jgi:methyl-accepting chemotaxis protein